MKTIRFYIALIAAGCTILTASFFPAPLFSANATDASTERDFSAIDKYAVATPKSAEKSPEKLAAYLMRAATTDVEKARAIARWITSNVRYDITAASGASEKPSNNADSVFATRRALDGGFANLFVRMMRSIGIETVNIYGVQKSFGYMPVDTTALKRRVWNAFRSKEGWRLVDLPIYTEDENSDGSYKTKYADAFFCIPPEQLIYTHLPDETKWQMLTTPFTREQFLQSVQYFGAYYGCRVTMLTHRDYAVTTQNRTLTMEFDVADSAHLGARVYGCGKELRSAAKWTRDGRKQTLTVKFPIAGAYKLELTSSEDIVRANVKSNDSKINAAATSLVGYAVKTIAEYGVTVEGKSGKSMAAR